ncbi:NUDIX domain-containing protein [uncultured Anaerococcus sp.]|uniref:NUDIX hydrolase n=1 Tax=uncultured Anaerococcus sp. TaxID=293428 RepID=UPI002639DFD4|nr:NUDIX domain-containing protein [uncultured Anaerococcus sp.]
MEILDLYDRYRRKTGKTYIRGDVMPPNTYRLIVHVLIFDRDGKMLIQQRKAEKTMGGLWDITCGGACQSGENTDQAASRELYEELGIAFNFRGSRPILTANFKYGFDDFYMIHKNVRLEDLRLQEEEVSDARWASYDEVIDLMKRGKFVKYKKSFIDLLFDLEKDKRFMEI